MNCQMFSTGFNSGDFDGKGSRVMLSGVFISLTLYSKKGTSGPENAVTGASGLGGGAPLRPSDIGPMSAMYIPAVFRFFWQNGGLPIRVCFVWESGCHKRVAGTAADSQNQTLLA